MENVEALATWLDAKFYRTDYRPVPLKEYVRIGSTIYSPNGEVQRVDSNDCGPAVSLCLEGLASGQQVLIFSGTKRGCETLCASLMDSVRQRQGGLCHRSEGDGGELALTQRLRLSEQLMSEECGNPNIKTFVTAGLAFHHSDLSELSRSLIEKAFKAGILSCLVATSTLATGVNLPAGRVVIDGLTIGRDTLSVVTFRQMCGRAGRAGQAALGEAFLIANQRESERAFALINSPYPAVVSQMSPKTDGGRGVLKALLEVFSLGLCENITDALSFLKGTLLYFSSTDEHRIEVLESGQKCLKFLVQARLIESKSAGFDSHTAIAITRFGLAAIEAGLNPDEVMVYYEDLYLAHEGLNLQTNLHLLYLITAIDHFIAPDFPMMWYVMHLTFPYLNLDSIGGGMRNRPIPIPNQRKSFRSSSMLLG